ncbi:MAG TPA: glycosyltransferase [Polyangia bacterium]|jgi:glycosyltransferase involved in cell wall biosynthesis
MVGVAAGLCVLPVAIMAHDEEECIGNAVESVLQQRVPAGFATRVVVVANACSDRTEPVVRGLAARFPHRIVLLPVATKGKTVAIQQAIRFLEEVDARRAAPFVVFLDADCEFADRDVLRRLLRNLRARPELCAVGARVRPDVVRNARTDVVAEMYRAVDRLAAGVRSNRISGMCYGIRLDVLRQIAFPALQLAEDMFVSARLDGWFATDPSATVLFRTPTDLRSEITRRTRQEVSTRRYRDYYAHLTRAGVRVKLRDGALGGEYRWRGASAVALMGTWLAQPGLKPKLLAASSALVLLGAHARAYGMMRALRRDEKLDYWSTAR